MQSELCIIWDLRSQQANNMTFFSPLCMSELFYNRSVLSATLTVLHFFFFLFIFIRGGNQLENEAAAGELLIRYIPNK